MLLQIVAVSLFCFTAVLGRCPNSCSGHGACGPANICTCYPQWNGGAADCSQRICPQGIAWADKAYAADVAHQQTECSNAGICNRDTGNCQCFPGFTGNACQRSSCPSDCSGHGVCSTIGDVSLYSGPDYDSTVVYSGDGLGVQYSNWDANSIQLCECDAGFFGADCSLAMCPKGDDPLTINQNYRSLLMRVRSTGSYDLEGQLGLTFMGKTVMLTIGDGSASTCTSELAFHGNFGNVLCSVTKNNRLEYDFTITFYSWPTYPKTSNLYSHDGNPSKFDFFCDVSQVTGPTACIFTDIQATNIQEYVYCSNRGLCNFVTGDCRCNDGFGGPACSNVTYLTHHGSNTLPGMQVNVNSLDYTSSALQINSLKSKASDFNMIEAIAGGEVVFSVRGDGTVSINKLVTVSGGHTVTSGGLFVESGGATIANTGLKVYSELTDQSVTQLSSTFTGPIGSSFSALRIKTVTTTPSQARAIEVLSKGARRFAVRADGHVIIYQAGLEVTGGITLNTGGLSLTGGATVNSGGVRVTAGGVGVTGGMTVFTDGMKVMLGGFQVFSGGAIVYSGGLKVSAGGSSIESGGFTVTGGVSVNTLGLKVTGGVTIYTRGITVKSQGATIESGGVFITTSGLTILSGGMRMTGGLSVTQGGLTATGGVTVVTGGMVVTTSGLTITNGGLVVTAGGITATGGLTVGNNGLVVNLNGLSVQSAGATITGGVTVGSGGMVITQTGVTITAGGLSVTNGGLTVVNGGLSVTNGGLTVKAGGLKVTGGATIHDTGLVVSTSGMTITFGGATVTGGVTVNDIGLVVTAGGLTVSNGGLSVTNGGLTVTAGGLSVTNGGLTVALGGLFVTGGATIYNTGLVVAQDGLSVNSGGITAANGLTVAADGLVVTNGGLTVTAGGLSVSANGLTIANGGLSVTAGGVSVEASGVKVTGGVTVNNVGLVVTANGLSVAADGMTVAGGMTVSTGGAVVTASGLTVTAGGLYVADGGMTVALGGLSINNGGLQVKAGGGQVTNGFTVHSGGLNVVSGGLIVAGGAAISNGMTVYGNLQVADTITTFTASDRRLKRNIMPIKDALDKVNRLNGVYFKWIQDEPNGLTFDSHQHVGVLAQEVYSVLPEVVTNIYDGKYLGVDYASMVPLVIEAVRELDELFQAGKITAAEKAEHTAAMFRQIQVDMQAMADRLGALEKEMAAVKERLGLR